MDGDDDWGDDEFARTSRTVASKAPSFSAPPFSSLLISTPEFGSSFRGRHVTDTGFSLSPAPKRRMMTKERAMLGGWAEDDDDDEFARFAGSGASKGKSKQSSSSSSGAFMFVSSGVFDLASGKTEEEPKAKPEETPANNFFDEGPKKPKKAVKAPAEPKLGQWEKYTKGVGSKMLKKMGWTGKGLGSNESGIVQPIQAVTRVVGQGLEEGEYMGVSKSVYRVDEKEAEVEQMEEKAKEERKGQWKKEPVAAVPKMPKIVYKTKEEYEKEMGLSAQKQAVLDMRAPKFGSQMDVSVPELPTFLPQLRHNMMHLVDLRVNAIHSIVKKRHYDEQMIRSLKDEEATLLHTVDAQKADITVLDGLKDRLEALRLNGAQGDMSLLAFFAELKDFFPDEYKRYKLESLIFRYVFPRLEQELAGWRPLQNPAGGVESAKEWKSLLDVKTDSLDEELDAYDDGFGISSKLRTERTKLSTQHSLDTFNRMMYEVFLPKLRQAVAEWDVFDPDPALDLLSTWKSILPKIGYHFLLYHSVGDKLKFAVEEYNPKLPNALPLDTWVLPWLPIMGLHNITELLELIRRKLLQAINGLNAEKGVDMLRPWKDVIDSHNWAQLMARGVLSKIEGLLRRIDIDPTDQKLEEWQEALVWSELVSPEAFSIALSESGFWKKWFNILGQWLHQEGADLDQVQQWYTSWKALFPAPLSKHSHIQPQFRAALQLMLGASSGEVPSLSDFVPIKIDYLQKQTREEEQREQAEKKRHAQALAAAQNMSLRDLLEDAARERGVLFMNTGRKHEGNPIFSFGKVSLFIERDLLFCHISGLWKPVPISFVLEHA